jgi:alpha-1,3-mannosyltransferase
VFHFLLFVGFYKSILGFLYLNVSYLMELKMKEVVSELPSVVHVVRQYFPAIGGLENFVKSLAEQQLNSGMDVTVITLNKNFSTGEVYPCQEVLNGVKIVRIPYFGSKRYPLAFSVLSKVPENSLLHVHCTDFFVDYLAFTKLVHSFPMVISTHGGFFHTQYASKLKVLYFNTITRLSLTLFKRVIACSVGDLQRFSSISRSVELIENGVEVEKFRSQALSGESNYIYIGRLSVNKRIDNLITTFSKVLERDNEATLSIVGNDFDGLAQGYNEKIDKLGLQGRINILSGLEDEQIREIVANSRYIVSASEYEGFGMTIIEGMAAGLVPIVNDIPSFRRIVEKSTTGLIVDFESEASSSQIIQYTKEYVDEISNVAIEYSKDYSWNVVEKKFRAVYRDVLGLDSMNIQGVSITNASSDQAIELIKNESKTGGLKLAYANAHTVNLASSDKELDQCLKDFLVLPDGIGVDIAAKYKYGHRFKENLNGTDFTPKLLEALPSSRIYIVGGREGVSKRAREIFETRYPQHNWVGDRNGYFDEKQSIQLIEDIKKSKVDILIVAMGNPIQEKWIAENFECSGARLAIGVGAFLDFTVGDVVRAPSWIRALRSEWIYRLAQEPLRLWQRYLLGNINFLIRTLTYRG